MSDPFQSKLLVEEYVVRSEFLLRGATRATGEVLTRNELGDHNAQCLSLRGWIEPIGPEPDEPDEPEAADAGAGDPGGDDPSIDGLELTESIVKKLKAQGLERRSQVVAYMKTDGAADQAGLTAQQLPVLFEALQASQPSTTDDDEDDDDDAAVAGAGDPGGDDPSIDGLELTESIVKKLKAQGLERRSQVVAYMTTDGAADQAGLTAQQLPVLFEALQASQPSTTDDDEDDDAADD